MFVWITLAYVVIGLGCAAAMLYRFGRTRAGIVGSIGFGWWAFAGLFRIASYIGQFDISSLNDFFMIAYILAFALVIYSWATLPTDVADESSAMPVKVLERPRVVTAIGWLLIALAIIGLFALLYIATVVEFDSRYLLILGPFALAALLQIGVGTGILAGINWVRIAYFVVAPASMAIVLAFGRFSSTSIIQLTIFAVAVYGLTRPDAVAYFRGRAAQAPPGPD